MLRFTSYGQGSSFSKVGQTFRSRSRVKNFGTNRKVSPQGMRLCNMKAQYVTVHKLRPTFKFFKSRSNMEVIVKKFGANRKVSPQGIHMCNMKAPYVMVQKLWPRFKFFKSRSNMEVKVTGQKLLYQQKELATQNAHV